jgi:hypothetical protein
MTTTKIKVNDKCPCASGKKYKKCCMHSDQENKLQPNDEFSIGHTISSENCQIVIDKLSEEYADHQVIDVSNILNQDTYRDIQTRNYYENTIMVVERNHNNYLVLDTRSRGNENMMVMYKGTYLCFNIIDFDITLKNISSMIDKRIDGQNL